MLDKIQALARQIETTFPGATTDLATFPSGAAMLDVRWRGRLLVMAYSPSGGWFGVDEVGDADGLGTDYRFVFKDFDQATEQLRRLLRSGA